MTRDAAFCPGCGAPVVAGDIHCQACGRRLRAGAGPVAFLVAVVVCAAAASGGLVWWVMSAPGAATASFPAAPAEDWNGAFSAFEPGPDLAAAADEARGRLKAWVEARDAAPAAGPPAAEPAASGQPGPDQLAAAPAQPEAVAVEPGADAGARRAFAKTTQQNFKENGLDLTVSTEGEDDTTIAIKFSFPAQTAVELIVSGPFPRRCRALGFQQVAFADSAGAAWTFDLASAQLKKK